MGPYPFFDFPSLRREESQRVIDVILSRREDFGVFDTYISEYDRSMSLLEESCKKNPAFAGIVKKFEVKRFTCRLHGVVVMDGDLWLCCLQI